MGELGGQFVSEWMIDSVPHPVAAGEGLIDVLLCEMPPGRTLREGLLDLMRQTTVESAEAIDCSWDLHFPVI